MRLWRAPKNTLFAPPAGSAEGAAPTPSAADVQLFVGQVLAVKVQGTAQPLAPWLASQECQHVLQALCEGRDPLFSDSARRRVVAEEDLPKFDAACSRSDLVFIAQEAVLCVLRDPQGYPNLCVNRGKKGKSDLPYASRSVLPDVFGDSNHPTVRFTLYRIVQAKVGYSAGARVPLPATLETLLRAAFPCSPQGLFDGTGFVPSQPRSSEPAVDFPGAATLFCSGGASAGGVAASAAGGGVAALSGTPLPPLYPAVAAVRDALGAPHSTPSAHSSISHVSHPVVSTAAFKGSGGSVSAGATLAAAPPPGPAPAAAHAAGAAVQQGKKRPRLVAAACRAAANAVQRGEEDCPCTSCITRGALELV